TATISNIVGVSASIEPTYQNLYVKSNLSGEFTIANKSLVNDLKKLNLWDEVMIADLKYFDGAISKIDRIPDNIRTLYATAFEMDPRWLIEAGARRQKWIDQSQSLNIYMGGVSGKKLDEIKVVVVGVGAAGTACTKILLNAGAKNVIGCDLFGAVYRGRTEGMNEATEWYAQHTNPDNLKGTLADVIEGADLFLGLSGPNVLKVEMLQKMNRDPIVFALANPTPEIMPEEAWPYVKVMATGRSDYPNQINNVLCFPGIFRGALDCRASDINEEMKLAAAHAIASVISPDELHPEYIIPSVFNRQVYPLVAKAVEEAARRSGVARRERTDGRTGNIGF
ncbi:MAG TPA: malic enzyme-like NAD(P)-binding protein, partial [Blastocatellia bacterium]|nr:malic enzyme-like NAD(P)-binding protein [Blastocatellia bacterium]